ncbi:MAG TPA: class D sortase [Terriglobales bacterium]|nr:class D sortase [Terriglobales bacterium]
MHSRAMPDRTHRTGEYLSGVARKLSARRAAAWLLLSAGIALLVFTLAAYGWMAFRQRRLTEAWQRQQSFQAAPQNGGTVEKADTGVTLLSIPKIGLNAGILDGTDRESLLLAPGHLKNTSWPGDAGNAVIAGHRDTFFRHVHELVTGDDIYVVRGGHRYHYVVSSKKLVDPSDVAVTRATSDSRLTLITCYPTYYIGPAPKRLIVVAELQPAGVSPPAAVASAPRP